MNCHHISPVLVLTAYWMFLHIRLPCRLYTILRTHLMYRYICLTKEHVRSTFGNTLQKRVCTHVTISAFKLVSIFAARFYASRLYQVPIRCSPDDDASTSKHVVKKATSLQVLAAFFYLFVVSLTTYQRLVL